MPRQALIQLAKQSAFASELALDLASRINSPVDVQHETANLEHKLARCTVVGRWCTRSFVVAVLAGFGAALACAADLAEHGDGGLAHAWAPFIMLGVLTTVLGSGLGALVVGQDLVECQSSLQYLLPMERTDEYFTAQSYLSAGYHNVLAWRDMALAERQTLYAFDMVVLRCLHYGPAEAGQKNGRLAGALTAGRPQAGVEAFGTATAGEACA